MHSFNRVWDQLRRYGAAWELRGTSAVFRSLAALATTAALEGCRSSLIATAGPVADSERVILLDSVAIMLCIVIPVILATLTFAWWFRASNTRARYLPNWSYSGQLELLVWSIPALVVLFLGGIAWLGSHDLDPGRPLLSRTKPLEVEVVSLDWKWLFIYPQQGLASVNQLIAPVGTPVHFRITSASVMNAFFIPQLGSQIYAMSGMTTQLNLQADRPGVYPGLSSQYSGDGFSGMAFEFKAVSAQEFADWVAMSHASGPVLDETAYRDLLRQNQDVKMRTYSAVVAGLFDRIVQQKLPPGEGPQTGDSNPDASRRQGN